MSQNPESSPPTAIASAVVSEPQPAAIVDAGAARNTILQLVSQVATLCFSGALTLYLVRALGAREYGAYALAASVAGLLLFPAGLGLPLAVGRFLADHRESTHQLGEIFRLGMKVQVPAAVIVGLALFAASGAVADAYGNPALGWPLRWMAVALVGQAVFGLLTSVGGSVRRSSLSLWITLVESAGETSTSIALVALGAGAAGAALGRAVGYGAATITGVYLTLRLLGRRRSRSGEPRRVNLSTLMRFAGAMFVVDVTWTAITQLDVLLIGALLSSTAVGTFGAVLRILTVLQYLGLAVSSGIAPRLSLAGGNPDVRSFETALRYLTIVQGVVIAPMLVWAGPIVRLLLGDGYPGAPGVMRVLTFYYFIAAPASLVTLSVTYLGEARRRVPVMIGTLAMGTVVTYVLIRVHGIIGAGIGDNVIEVVYLGAHLWICSTLIDVDLRGFGRCVFRTLLAAGAMALVLVAVGTGQLSPAQWAVGSCAGAFVFLATLVVTRELTVAEIRGVVHGVGTGLRGG